MKEKITLITGASGEIGQNLISEFSKSSRKKIIAIDLNKLSTSNSIYSFYESSILDDSLLSNLNDNYIIEEIYHLAAILSTKAEKNPKIAEEVNIKGTLNLFNLALSQNIKNKVLTKFFFPSSIAVYNINTCDNKSKLITENSYCNPRTIYGKHKLFCENSGIAFDIYGNEINAHIDFRCIRFPGIISANSMPTGGTSDYAPELIHRAFKNTTYQCFVKDYTCLPFMVMPDAVNAIIKIMQIDKEKLKKNVYNIQAFNPTVNELYEIIKLKFPKFKLSYSIDEMRQLIVDSWPNFVDDCKAKEDWGWKPMYNLENAFKKYLEPILGEK